MDLQHAIKQERIKFTAELRQRQMQMDQMNSKH